MLFGDTESYKNKLKTCARSRPIVCKISSDKNKSAILERPVIKPCQQCSTVKLTRPLRCQILNKEFYSKESTKPIFEKHGLLTVHNLYRLRCIMEFFKIMKYRLPIAIYSLFTRSKRKDNLIITPTPSHNFTYKSSWLWNQFSNTVNNLDFGNTSCNSLKSCLNRSLQNAQDRHGNDWQDVNFSEFRPLLTYIIPT